LRLESIRIANFRNHSLLEFEPGPSITVIHGRNGTGKTSLLEAVHFCALTRGFAGNADRECLLFGRDHFSIKARFVSDRNTTTEVRVFYTAEKEKQVYVNEQEITSFSRHIGTIPCVTFTPPELAIVTGSPSERRKFMDTAICQHDRRYLADLIQYRRVLQQRNALLAGSMDNSSRLDGLEIWTEQLSALAASIIMSRKDFLRRFSVMFREIHSWFPDGQEPAIEYHSSLGDIDGEYGIEDLSAFFNERYRILRRQEIQRCQTLAGPHRDDLRFYNNGHEIRKFSSQGQQRGYLVAMKLSLHHYLNEVLGERPVTLLDDLFSELDDMVEERITESLASCGQVLITSTQMKTGNGVAPFSMERRT
jgi:DNA replication and repair protein RecF